MSFEGYEIESLVKDLSSLLQHLRADGEVKAAELDYIAKTVYSLVRNSLRVPLDPRHEMALLLLSAAPPHKSLDPWRWRAEGILDACLRLGPSSVPGPVSKGEEDKEQEPTLPSPENDEPEEEPANGGDGLLSPPSDF